MPRAAWLGLVAIGFALAGGPGAAAAPRPLALGSASGWLLSDGNRWVVWQVTDATLRILDARDGTIDDVASPEGCSDASGIGGGQLLWTCEDPSTIPTDHPLLMDLSTGRWHLPAGYEQFYGPGAEGGCESRNWVGVGRYWLAEYCSGYRSSYIQYLNWRTGEVGQLGDDVRSQLSLDEPDGLVELCSPLRRPKNPYYEPDDPFGDPGEPLLNFQYAKPWALRPRLDPAKPLRLQHCGGRTTRLVARCAKRCEDVELSAGLMTWSTEGAVRWMRPGHAVHTVAHVADLLELSHAGRIIVASLGEVHDIATRRVVAWRLPGAPPLPDVSSHAR